MKGGHYIITILSMILFYSSPVLGQGIVEDINSILKIEEEPNTQKEQLQQEQIKKAPPARKQIISRYSEDNLPRAKDFVDAFKIAVEVVFGESKEDTAVDSIRNAAYILKGTSTFVIQGLEYCMQQQYLGAKGKEAQEAFLEKNEIILTNVDLVFSKTKPLSARERRILNNFSKKVITEEFTSIAKCVQHEYQVMRGNYTLSTYSKTKDYVDIVNSFLRTE